jgi:hypothetical protein
MRSVEDGRRLEQLREVREILDHLHGTADIAIRLFHRSGVDPGLASLGDPSHRRPVRCPGDRVSGGCADDRTRPAKSAYPLQDLADAEELPPCGITGQSRPGERCSDYRFHRPVVSDRAIAFAHGHSRTARRRHACSSIEAAPALPRPLQASRSSACAVPLGGT